MASGRPTYPRPTIPTPATPLGWLMGWMLFLLGLLRRRGGVRHFFGAAEDTALVRFGDGVAARLLARQDLRGVDLAVVLRAIAEAMGVRVVVPGALVPGDAVDDLELDVRMVDADGDELRQVARAEPERQAPLV